MHSLYICVGEKKTGWFIFLIFPYNGYGSYHRSFPAGWEACLALFYRQSLQPQLAEYTAKTLC